MKKSIISILAVLTVTVLSTSAFAQLRQNPVFGQRNLTNAKNTLEVIAGPLSNYGAGGITVNHVNGTEIAGVKVDGVTSIGLNAGAAFGVNNDLSIGGILPLALSPDAALGNPELFGRYRFLHGSTEAAAQLSFAIPAKSGSSFNMNIAVPVRMRGEFRLDLTPTLGLNFSDPIAMSVALPVGLYYNFAPNVFAGLQTGVNLTNEFNTIGIPLGLGAGYTLQAAEGPMLDATVSFTLPAFFDKDAGIGTDVWQLGLGVNYHLYL